MDVPSKASSLRWHTIILFGASTVQYGFSYEGCWGALLADKLQRKCDVINRGFSGYNTRWNKLILPRIVDGISAKDVAAVVIFLGANDSVLPDLNPRQYVPLEEYRLNLVDMVEYLMSVKINRHKVVLITPPPCDVPGYTAHCKTQDRVMTKCQTLTVKYAEACQRAATESGAQCVDLYTEMIKQKDWQRFLVDGLHLSKEGSHFLDSLLWPQIEKLTAHIEVNLPIWDQVDYADPARSLVEDQ